MTNSEKIVGFWLWFCRGTGGEPGFKRLLDRWLILHLVAGSFLAFVVPVDLQGAANAVLLPLVGILIGLTFAWAGNAQALMQSAEIQELSEHHEGGFEEYVYTFQLAILVVLTTIVVWGLAGLSLLDKVWPTQDRPTLYFLIKLIHYALASMTLRECWHVVLAAQLMLLIQRKIKKVKGNK